MPIVSIFFMRLFLGLTAPLFPLYRGTKVGSFRWPLPLTTSISLQDRLITLLRSGMVRANNVYIHLTTILIKYGEWHTTMMGLNLCPCRRTRVFISIIYLYEFLLLRFHVFLNQITLTTRKKNCVTYIICVMVYESWKICQLLIIYF